MFKHGSRFISKPINFKSMNKLNLVSAAAGLCIFVGAGLIYNNQYVYGLIILIIGLLNSVQMYRLWKSEKNKP